MPPSRRNEVALGRIQGLSGLRALARGTGSALDSKSGGEADQVENRQLASNNHEQG